MCESRFLLSLLTSSLFFCPRLRADHRSPLIELFFCAGSTDIPTWKPSSTQVRSLSVNSTRLVFPSLSCTVLRKLTATLFVSPQLDEFFVPAALAETLRRMFEPNPKERWSAEQIINTLSTLDLAARGNPQLGGKGGQPLLFSFHPRNRFSSFPQLNSPPSRFRSSR